MKETPKRDEYKIQYQEQLNRLRGREAEFALQLVEYIVSHPIMEDLEFEFGVHPERIEEGDADYLRDNLTKLYKNISPIYSITHSFNKAHSCHHVHDPWRDAAVELYKKMVDSEWISDAFNLFGDQEVITLNPADYHSVYISEPDDVESEFTFLAKSGELFSDGSINQTELSLIRSKKGGNRFVVDHDYVNHHHGKTVIIDEDALTAMDAKRRLIDNDEG